MYVWYIDIKVSLLGWCLTIYTTLRISERFRFTALCEYWRIWCPTLCYTLASFGFKGGICYCCMGNHLKISQNVGLALTEVAGRRSLRRLTLFGRVYLILYLYFMKLWLLCYMTNRYCVKRGTEPTQVSKKFIRRKICLIKDLQQRAALCWTPCSSSSSSSRSSSSSM